MTVSKRVSKTGVFRRFRGEKDESGVPKGNQGRFASALESVPLWCGFPSRKDQSKSFFQINETRQNWTFLPLFTLGGVSKRVSKNDLHYPSILPNPILNSSPVSNGN